VRASNFRLAKRMRLTGSSKNTTTIRFDQFFTLSDTLAFSSVCCRERPFRFERLIQDGCPVGIWSRIRTGRHGKVRAARSCCNTAACSRPKCSPTLHFGDKALRYLYFRLLEGVRRCARSDGAGERKEQCHSVQVPQK